MPEFSVILPVYNVEKYIAQSLKSILKQTFRDFEILCVNDCTPDSSMQIVEKFAQNDSRIKIINHDVNKGLGAARNTALTQANGKYIVCVDSDDWIETEFLEKVKKGFEEYNVDSVWVKYWVFEEKTDYAHISSSFPAIAHFPGGKYTLNPKNIHYFPAYSWNKVFKTDLILKNNHRWMEDVYYEDMYLYYDYFINNPQIYIINEMLYYYRRRENSITQNSAIDSQKINDMFDVLTIVYNMVEVQGYNSNYKESVKTAAKNYNLQWRNNLLSNFAEKKYNEFLHECKN